MRLFGNIFLLMLILLNMVVFGCGKKATYIYAPEGGAILNSPIEASSVAAAESPKTL